MKRWIPWLLVPAIPCSPSGGGDDCDEDADCDTEAGQFCEFATDATEDEEGACAEPTDDIG